MLGTLRMSITADENSLHRHLQASVKWPSDRKLRELALARDINLIIESTGVFTCKEASKHLKSYAKKTPPQGRMMMAISWRE